MDLHMLDSLQRAIPVVLRHLDAYIELAERDLAEARSAAVSKLQALWLFGLSVAFALLFASVLVIAMAWDGEYRFAVIGTLVGLYALCAIVAATWLLRKREKPFATLRREWREDRALIQRLLSQDLGRPMEEAT